MRWPVRGSSPAGPAAGPGRPASTAFDRLARSGRLVTPTAVVATLSSARGLVVMLADAGFGKSTALAAWAHTEERRHCRVDLSDTRGSSITQVLLEALAGCAQPPGRAAPSGQLWQDVDRLVGRLPRPGVVVVDGVEQVTSTHDLDMLRALCAHADDDLLVVLSGRRIEPTTIARLRAGHDVTTVTARELSIDPGSYETVLGEPLDAQQRTLLAERTQGWPVALHLARLARATGTSADAGVDKGADAGLLDGDDPVVADYLAAEVFDSLDPAALDLVTRTAVFDTVTGGLADSACRTTASHQLLEQVAKDHTLLEPVDRQRTEFRWHPLVRQALVARLQRQLPDEVAELRERGAAWYLAHHRPQPAVQQLLASGDRASSVELLEQILLPMFHGGQQAQLIEWIREIGAEYGDGSGFLATCLSYAAMMSGDITCTDRWHQVAARFYPAGQPDASGYPAYLVLRALRMPDGVTAMLRDTTELARLVPEASPWRGPALMLHGVALYLAGQLAEAHPTLDQAVHTGLESAANPAVVVALAFRSIVATAQGQGASARRHAAEALQVVENAHLSEYPLSSIVFALSARFAAAHDERHGAQPVRPGGPDPVRHHRSPALGRRTLTARASAHRNAARRARCRRHPAARVHRAAGRDDRPGPAGAGPGDHAQRDRGAGPHPSRRTPAHTS